MLEHRRASTNPEKHPNNALANHYISEHETLATLLKYSVLKSHLTFNIKRKISDVLFIRECKPELNVQDEMICISRFLV